MGEPQAKGRCVYVCVYTGVSKGMGQTAVAYRGV
jgi:hypothetical protein